jgi:Ca2+-transporting ATPase
VGTRPPRAATEPALTDRHWHAIAGYGVLLMATVVVSLWLALRVAGLTEARAVTTSFVTLGFSQTLHVFNMRGPRSHPLVNEVTTNPWMWAALAICAVLIGAAVFLPGLSGVLLTEDPGPAGWLIVLMMSPVPVLIVQFFRILTHPTRAETTVPA